MIKKSYELGKQEVREEWKKSINSNSWNNNTYY